MVLPTLSFRISLAVGLAGFALLALMAQAFLGEAATLVLLAALAWPAAGWFGRPLHRLAAAAARQRRLGTLPGSAEPDDTLPRTGVAELNGLAATFAGLLEDCRRSEARLLMAQEAAGIGCWDADPRSGLQVWSRPQFALFGLDPDGPAPDHARWRALVHPEDLPKLRDAVRQAAHQAAHQKAGRGPATFTAEFRIHRADDGSERWLAASGQVEADAAGRPIRMLGINRDVTARRQREAALSSREAALRALVEANPIGVLRGGTGGSIRDANDALLRLIGRSRAELEAGVLRWDAITPPEWRAADAAAMAEVAATGRCTPFEKEYARPDGSRLPVLVGFTLIGEPGVGEPGVGGAGVGGAGVGEAGDELVAFILDLSGRKQAEGALLRAKAELEARVAERTATLAEREAELRRIYDRTPAAFHCCDGEGRLIEVSAEWLGFLGYRREEVLGRRPAEFMIPESATRWEFARTALLASHDQVREVEYRMLRRDGRVVEVLLRARAEYDEAGVFRRSFAVLLDITERNRSEARLREAQKLEALGRIAGGVAHDFNNMLQVMNGALRLVESRPDDPDRVRRYAHAALAAAERGADITRRMLAFARRDQLQSGPVQPAAVLEGLATLLHGTLGPDIRLEVTAPPGLPALRADRMQLDLVLFNLALNARDAMPAGGVLRLGVVREDLTVPARPPMPAPMPPLPLPGSASGLPPGHYLRLSIGDTGAGMDALTLARAIEPFFTTKEVGKGTGLGLAMAHGFALQSGGALAIESAPGQGTVVCLWLPQADAPGAVPAAPPEGEATGGAGRPPRVLMVEDEAPLRQVMAAALREEGLLVTEAADAPAALRLLDAGLDCDVVLTDHAMPGMTGGALATELARRYPGLAVAILSGNADPPPVALPPGVTVLLKPFGTAELAARLRLLA